MFSPLLTQFCTPPESIYSKSEQKALENAETFTIPFEEYPINCYAWGDGPAVILSHGWGSRAGHFVLMARILAAAGYRTVAYDAPGHTSFGRRRVRPDSSLFQFSKAVSSVAEYHDEVYAVIGHSLGAMAAVLTMAGYPLLQPFRFSTQKIVCISMPASLDLVLKEFCRERNMEKQAFTALKTELDAAFSIDSSVYNCREAAETLSIDTLVVQDTEDEYFSPEETLINAGGRDNLYIKTTKGLGHDRIITSRTVFKYITEFLNS